MNLKDSWLGLNLTAKIFTIVFPAIGGTAGMVVAVPPAWSMLGLFEPASKTYVRNYVEPIKLAQNSTNIAVDRLLLAQLETALYQAQQDPAANNSRVIQERIRELQSQIEDAKHRIALASR